MLRKSIITLTLLMPPLLLANSPYQGQEQRTIKALSDADVDALLDGRGWGFAKAAELNHYPGPRHVLDMAEELKLTPEQQKQTQDLFNRMRAKARQLGKELVESERRLDQAFASAEIDAERLNRLLEDIASARKKLRYVHLQAHLEQRGILDRHQVMVYDRVRGYGAGGGHEHGHGH